MVMPVRVTCASSTPTMAASGSTGTRRWLPQARTHRTSSSISRWASDRWRCSMRRHEPNYTGLISGLLFLAIGAYALLVGPDRLGDALRWLWPIMLLGLGVALLV